MPSRQLDRVLLEVLVGRKDAPPSVKLASQRYGRQPLRIVAIKDNRFLGKVVEVWSIYPGAAISRQIVGAKRIGDQHDQVEIISLLARRSLPVRLRLLRRSAGLGSGRSFAAHDARK